MKYLILIALLISNLAVADDETYKQGAIDGCNSGKKATGSWGVSFTKDIDKYVSDPYYKSGWDDGFIYCKAEGERMNQIIDQSMGRW